MQSLIATRAERFSNSVQHAAYHLARRSNDDLVETIEMIGTDVPFAKGGQIYGEGEPSVYFYKIMSGLARCFRMTPDGRRQIVVFYVPGDLFGFEVGDRHTLSVEAITDCRICLIKRTSVINAAAHDHVMARELWMNISREIRRGQEHILQFGRPACARVASFLLEMVQRVPTANAKALAISRQDIADYLDLRIETVSRAMARLARAGAIAPSSRRKITIRDPGALHQVAD
jgi:CRP/FNR family nitrogen fixation transcriptional regulator